ncbi:MAG: hypothetical protein COT15_01615 [Candidatus Diapherotrites archaeon CG08_land_8_20_14_0_20_34_12]|nr:MAG: hypothetical protein COT15_01615 [Candidatus Diapherotrites archaeon CG08_land_8_20_14_0_20_34_12]
MALSNKKNIVALDTNILFSISQYKIDIFDEIERLLGKTNFVITEAIDAELDKLSKKNKKEVNIAREVIAKKNVKKVKTESKIADTSLVELAKQGYIIATADKALKKRIKDYGGTLIYLRQKKYLEMDN